MSAYGAMFAARFRILLEYRGAALAGIGTQIFWGLLRSAAFTAFYRSSTRSHPLALEEVVTYVWLTQALLMLLPWRPDPDVETLLRTGQMAVELARPADMYGLWFARALALRTARATLRCVPMAALALLAFDMRLPASPLAALVFALSVLAAVLLSAAITTLQSISLMFTTSGRGIQMLTGSLVSVFSGSLVPLLLLPGWMAAIAGVMPFRGLMDTPFRFYLGHLDGWGLLLLHQLGWTAFFVLAGRALVRAAIRRIEVHGG